MLEDAVAAVELARKYVDDVEFSAEDGTRTEPEFLEKFAKAVVAAGARTVNLPDTVGYSTPKEYGALIGQIARALGDCAIVSVHCHDDLGLAVANSLAAVQAGARQIECTINGIGERAGNCSLEEVVMVLKTRHDSYPYHTGIHTEHLYPASETLSSLITFGPQPNKAIVGRTPSRTRRASTRTATSRRRPPTRSSIRSRWACPRAGWCWASTAAATRIGHRCKDLGYELTREELDELYHRFTAVADHRKKGLMDEEIVALIPRREKAMRVAAD